MSKLRLIQGLKKLIQSMHNFKSNYDKAFDIIKPLVWDVIDPKDNYIKSIKVPKMSDLQIVTINLVSEYMSINSENLLFKKLKSENLTDFPSLIERSVYNRRKRKLIPFLEIVRQRLSQRFTQFEDYFIIDSMPLAICRNARASGLKICKEAFETSPDYGFCASQNQHYFGYKLHGVCTIEGVFTAIEITKASVHDILVLQDVRTQLSDCVILGDKGYLSAEVQLDLFTTQNVKLEVPKRNNQKGAKSYPYIFRKTRKRIETQLSQLCDQFTIRTNFAKTFEGFKTRILSKITAMTMVQFINKFINHKPVNHLKHAIC
jgi:hypothetical protein